MKSVIRSPHYAQQLVPVIRRLLRTEPVVPQDEAECCRAVGEADVLFCQPSQISPELVRAMAQAPRLRWLQVLGSGVDKLASLERPDLVITNAADAYGPAVAEHAVALALALFRRIPELVEARERRQWTKPSTDDRLDSLEGAVAAVVGYGAIGAAIVRRLDAFDASSIRVVRRRPVPSPDGEAGRVRFLPLDEALSGADIVFLAVPLTGQTRRLVDAARLAHLAPGARLVNVSRGNVVDTDALIAALASGALSGAALDVFETEPLPTASPLWALPNLIVSPHVAGRGNRRVTERIIGICERNITAFAAGDLRSSQ
ncbi:D-2-hydroxyacid dehydrogenase [Ancylobacter mangrovi]|uniref:D-2-hydroxyacid dehydrogenase n=1 Tax=Ancylobacter mangrovi TaxID=2972472 RepID=UPI0021637C94|nr:D-2-hydroxyacid dehydrogenase [Ancylobacter mangrovi]MCS0505019.1 D-2-hydroxyacid dehydrogenase [Ancylobacter mangrovi]